MSARLVRQTAAEPLTQETCAPASVTHPAELPRRFLVSGRTRCVAIHRIKEYNNG